MIVYEFKVKGKEAQYRTIDEAIRTSQFIQNKCLRYWMDNKRLRQYDLNKYCAVLAAEFPFAEELNSMARQSAAERTWSAISRFFDNCKKKVKGKKGYPKFKKHCRSVEYKTSGWKLSPNRKSITFRDGKNIGTLKLKGTYDLNYYDIKQIKRVRLVRRADGYYAQFAIDVKVRVEPNLTGKMVGLDLGLKFFIADNEGNTEPCPQFYRKSQRQLNRVNRKKSKKFVKGAKPQSKNYHKARNRYARLHLGVSRQRKEYCKRVAYSVIQSNDLVAYEDLRIKNLVKNHCLAKSINDAGWYQFRKWLEYFGVKFGKITVAVNPAYTSQACSSCGSVVKKSLSMRTHACKCGFALDRDWNAAINILKLALSTVGHTGTWILDPNASGDSTSTLLGAILSGQVGSMNEESPRL